MQQTYSSSTGAQASLSGDFPVSAERISDFAAIYQLLSDPSRLRIVFSCLNAPISVGDIAQKLGFSASLVSHHLRLLRVQQIIQSERQGTRVFYQVSDAYVRDILRLACETRGKED